MVLVLENRTEHRREKHETITSLHGKTLNNTIFF